MKSIWTKRCLTVLAVVSVCVALLSFSCTSDKGSANTAFADTASAVSIPQDALSVVESLQKVYRSVSSGVLPSVVELDVVEKKIVENQMENFPFFFFGIPDTSGDSGTREYEEAGLGSGVIVRKVGNVYYILTNNHVAGTATEISVKLNDGRTFTGKLVGADDRKDIALVSFESDDSTIPVANIGDSDTVQSGDICFAMGTPLGYYSSVTQGIVSATGRTGSGINNISDFIQTDTAINQGNSGGPLVNIYGEVIGINTWIASQSGGSVGLGFAIPINNIKKAIDDFINKGKVTYGWMGVTLVEMDKDYLKELGVENKNGAFATYIFIGSPAAKGGMQAGDYVIKLNGKDVKSTDQLVRDVGDLTVGERAVFVVIRGGKEVTLNIDIEERTNEVTADNSKMWPGFIAYPITDELRTKLSIDKKVEGIVVTNIQAKSPAASMRLQAGDIITAVNDKKVTSVKEFYEALDTTTQKEIWFDCYNDGRTLTTGKYKF